METQGQPMDTPERGASVAVALERRVNDIGDPVVRRYYHDEIVRKRLWEARRGGRPTGARSPIRRDDARFRRPSVFGGRGRFADEAPAWFAEGTALRQAAHDLDSRRRERVLLGALAARPAWLHLLAEDVADLPLSQAELDQMRALLLDVAGLDLAGEDSSDASRQAAERQELTRRAEAAGLTGLLAALCHDAEQWLAANDAEVALGKWRHIAGHHRRLARETADRQAAVALVADRAPHDGPDAQELIRRSLRSAKVGSED
jgi:hypothetical protein